MGGLYLASHPAPVRRAIDRHRRGLDAEPGRLPARARRRARGAASSAPRPLPRRAPDRHRADRHDDDGPRPALHRPRPARRTRRSLTTTHDFYATHEALRSRRRRTRRDRPAGAALSRPARRDRGRDRRRARAAPSDRRTRVVAVTWVHSSTGVKLPMRRIADALGAASAAGSLLCVDGVHGLGVEDATRRRPRLRLLRRRLPQVAVRAARDRARLGPPDGLAGGRPDDPVVLGRRLRAPTARPAASTRSSTAGRSPRRSASTAGSARRASPRGSTRSTGS